MILIAVKLAYLEYILFLELANSRVEAYQKYTISVDSSQKQ